MKKFPFILAMLCLSIIAIAAAVGPIETTSKGKIAKASTCAGIGICSLNSSASAIEAAKQSDITFKVDATTRLLQILFDIPQIQTKQPDVYKQLNGKTTFTFDEPTPLADVVTNAVKLPFRYYIPKGTYPMSKVGTKWVVSIKF